MSSAPGSAKNLSRQAAHLSQQMGLIHGISGLTSADEATAVTKHLAYVAEQLGLQAMLLSEFLRIESSADRLEAHPGLGGLKEVDVTRNEALFFQGARSVTIAADSAARTLDRMHELVGDLDTRGGTWPERTGVDPVLRSKGFALNVIHAAALGDADLLRALVRRVTPDEAAELTAIIDTTARALSATHGPDSASPHGGPGTCGHDG